MQLCLRSANHSGTINLNIVMHPIRSNTIYTGLSGLQLPIPKYQFPPPFENASRLTYYSTFFNSIEINSSFYKIPQATTVSRWAASVPDNFRFTFKLWNGITHDRNLNFSHEDITSFFTSINAAKDKKGCLLIQLPPGLNSENIAPLQTLLSSISEINSSQEWNIAVEFRHSSWYRQNVYDLLAEFNAAIVIQDMNASSTPLLCPTTEFIYLRFHGPKGNYRDSYSNDFLSEYAAYIIEWIEEGKTVFVYFNNTIGDAFQNARILHDLLSEKLN